MQVKDKKYMLNIFKRISESVKTANEKILAQQQGKLSLEQLKATLALEQLGMQHEILIVLATMIFDPGTDTEPLPEMPKKIIGFN